MVFESIVADLLNRFLGDYVQNFDSSKLKLGIWGGDVTLKHLDVKESALDDLDLPVKVISGHLGQLVLKIPWKNMYTSPVIATIEGLYVVVIPNLAIKYDAEKEEKAVQAAKQLQLQRIEEAKEKLAAEKGDSKDDKKDTFTEKLVTQIIKNLQVKIKDIHIRYEDSISDRNNAFGVGFTLHNLSFETTNEKWIPAIIHENISIIHKLVTLDSLAIYWNSSTTLLSNMSSEERQAAMEKGIATSTYKPSNAAYMLGPINSTAQLRLNSKPELDDCKIPKVWLNVVMEEIAIGVAKRQYQDLMKLLESFDRMTIATLYRKYRPDVPHAGHAKEWWKFAITAVLEEDVRRKRRNWSWQHMKDHRIHCKFYKDLYVSKLATKKMSSDMQLQICDCEKKLDLFSITMIRKQAELELLRNPKKKEQKGKTWGGWLGGWFASDAQQQVQDDSAGKKIVKQFEEAMTTEEKAKLFEAIGYQEQIVITEYPIEFVENKLLFLLHNLTLSLTDDTRRDSQVLKTVLKHVSACVEQRPAAQAISIETKMESFAVHGVPLHNGPIPTIAISRQITSQQLKQEKSKSLLRVLFETNPLDGSCDHRLHVQAEPLEIIYNALTINRLVEVFKPPEQIELQQLQATALLKLEEMKEMSAFGLQYAIEQHKYLDLKVDVQPTFIVIPENGNYDINIHLLVVSLGNFKMDSLKRDQELSTVRSLIRAGSTEGEVLSAMIDKAYDKYHIEIQNAEIILTGPNEDWRNIVGSQDSTQHLLHPVSVKIDLNKSIVSVDPRMPKMKIIGVLPLLDLGISDKQIFDLLKLVKSIPFPENESPPPRFKSGAKPLAVDCNTINAKALQQAKKEAVETMKEDINKSDDEEEVVDSSRLQSTDLEMKFEINEFGFTFFRVVDKTPTKMLRFCFNRFGTAMTMRTFDMYVDVYLGTILLEHSGYFHHGHPVKLISTPLKESSENLFALKYLQADKKGPDFETEYNSTLQLISVTLRNIQVILHQEAILAIMEFSGALMATIDSLSQETEVKTVKSSESIVPLKDDESKQFGKNLESKTQAVTKKRKTLSKVIDMELRANLDSIGIVVCTVSYELTDIQIKGMKAAVIIQKAKTSVTASVKDMIVADPTKGAFYPTILSTIAGEVLDLKVVLYNDATEDENYIDMSAVDMSVCVSFGRMKIVFLNKFVSSLLFFLDHFQTAKDKVAEASAVAAEAAKHGMEQVYEKATRILLNILIQAPMIIVPQNSTSKNSVIADLGTLKISNNFELSTKRNELGIPAILDKMVLDLLNLQLSRALVEPELVEIVAECLLVEPVTFCLAVVRNLSSGWYVERPEVDIFGKLEAVKMSMSQEDYSTVMSILSENLTETHSETKSVSSSSISSTANNIDNVRSKGPTASLSAAPVKPVRKLTVADIIPQKVVTRFKFGFEMNSASVNFYSGVTVLTQFTNKRDPAQSIAEVEIKKIDIEAEIMSDNSMTASVLLVDFVLDDTRICRKKGITRLMQRTPKQGAENMINVAFKQTEDGEKTLNVKVSSFTLVVCLPYILQLGEFFSTVSTGDDQAQITQTIPTAPVAIKTTNATALESPSSVSTTIIFLKIEEPDLVLIDDIEDTNSSAIFLNNEIIAKVTISDTSKVISGKVSNLTFYTACFNPEQRSATMVKILSPSDIDLQCNMSEDTQHIDLLFRDLILHISPGTVQLLMNILSGLVTEKVTEEVVKEKIIPDYSDLWHVKRLSDCDFWFLETLAGRDKAFEASEIFMGIAPDDSGIFPPSQQMLFTMRKIILTIEAGVGTRTVPMLLLESSFQSQILDWSSDIQIESSLSVEVSYYNEKIAVWEPLLEPVETSKGHRSWELYMEVTKRAEEEAVTEEETEPLPPPMRIEVKSDDVMELTVSKTSLDVLTNLSQAFGEAVKPNAVRDNKRPSAPYQVFNYLGIPITVILNNSFQILDAKEDYKNVILESGSPALHLIHSVTRADSSARLSMLKRQDVKEDIAFNVKIVTEDMNIERRVSVACTDKRYFQLPRRTYPGDKWGFIIDIKSHYGSKIITFHSILQVFNHFSVPIDVYYMISAINEVKWCGTVKPNTRQHIPMHALYTITSELFFKPEDDDQSYSLTGEPFVWKELMDNPSANRIVRCKGKDSVEHSFYMNVSGEVERIFFEETNKKTLTSSFFKINLYPTVRLRNLLLFPINYSLQGVDKDFRLSEGETHELWTAEIGKTGLEIRLLNYLDRDWVCYRTLEEDIDELSVWTFETCILDKNFTLELGMHTQKMNGSLVMELYSPYCMVNKTGLLLTYRGEEDNIIYHPAELGMPVLFSFKAKAFFSKKKISLKINDSEWSDKFSLDAVGSSGNVVAKSKDGKTYGIGVQIKLSQTGLMKMIIFTPFYLLVNNCDFDIECQEIAEAADWIKVAKEECVPFWPSDAAKAQMVARFCSDDTQTEAFSFKDNHSTLLRLNSSRGGIHIDCQAAESSVILTFEDYFPGHAAALVVNHMKNYCLTFCQSGGKQEVELPPDNCILYCWENPLQKRLLNWKCNDKKDGIDDLVKDGLGEFNPDSDVKAFWLSFLDGMQRILVFTDDINRAFAVQSVIQSVRMEQEFLVMLKGVGISLVNNDTKCEIMYIGITSSGIVWEGKKEKSHRYKTLSLKECGILEISYQRYQNELKIGKEPRRIQTLEGRMEVDFEHLKMLKPVVRNLKRTFHTGLWIDYKKSFCASYLHAKINRLQIDNQLVDCVFPVVLAPVAPPKSVAQENAPKPFTELSLMLRKEEHSPIQQIKYCKILVQEFHVKLDQGFINSLIMFFTAEQPAEINHIEILELDQEVVNSKLKDVAAIYSSQEQKCYFDNLHFSPLKVHISFSMTGAAGQKDGNKPTPIHSDFLNLLLQSVGVTLTEVQDVVFKLDYFERKYVFMSMKQLISEATGHYTNQAVKQLYMLVLGLDVIGNPVGLILGLGEGVTDLFYEPFQGAIQGPDEFLEGLGLGVKSLFGHAIGGAAGAASRITGTLGKGLAALTMDKDYQKKRRQNMNRRPQDIGQGLAQSGKGLLMGVLDGVTGVVTKPIEGAREEGVGGFFKGIGKGLIGIVTRPTAGAVDFASGSFDAVKRLADLSDEVKRLRSPRYIRTDGIIRPYTKRESEGNKLLQEVEKGKYANTDVYEAHIAVGTDDKSFLVVTNNRLMYIDKGEVFGQWNTEWEFRWEELREVPSVTEKGIKIMLKDPHKKKMSLFGSKIAGKLVHARDRQQSMWICAKIEEIMKKPK